MKCLQIHCMGAPLYCLASWRWRSLRICWCIRLRMLAHVHGPQGQLPPIYADSHGPARGVGGRGAVKGSYSQSLVSDRNAIYFRCPAHPKEHEECLIEEMCWFRWEINYKTIAVNFCAQTNRLANKKMHNTKQNKEKNQANQIRKNKTKQMWKNRKRVA